MKNPTEFTIEVSSGIDGEYIQKLAFKNGGSWMPANTTDIMKYTDRAKWYYIEDKNIRGWDDNVNTSTSLPIYKFPSQAEEIVKLFEKEKEPEFKVGDWIIFPDGWAGWFNAGDCAKIEEVCLRGNIYVAGLLKYKQQGGFPIAKKSFRHASPSEIETFLIKEAKETGFVVGAKLQHEDKVPFVLTGLKLVVDGENNSLLCNRYFRNNGYHLRAEFNSCSMVPLPECTLAPSHPSIKINGYVAKFEDWGLDFNDGCAKIDKDLFIALAKTRYESTGKGNKVITSVKIGSGEFTASQIKEIADYYNSQAK